MGAPVEQRRAVRRTGAPPPSSSLLREAGMETPKLTRRAVLRSATLATTALALPFVRGTHAAEKVVPGGSMVLAWHTNIAPRWLDPAAA